MPGIAPPRANFTCFRLSHPAPGHSLLWIDPIVKNKAHFDLVPVHDLRRRWRNNSEPGMFLLQNGHHLLLIASHISLRSEHRFAMHPVFREDRGHMHAANSTLNAAAPKIIIFPAILYVGISTNPDPRPFSYKCHRIHVIATDETARQEVIHTHKPARVAKLLD